tara:strand:+ start:108 stop:446 length:339 start_codon:yes stop_codon:yes gene_type:complete
MTELNQDKREQFAKAAAANRELVSRLAEIHCTLDEIAVVTGISKAKLESKYAKELALGKANGKSGLRRTQMTRALDGDPRMLIFLGKNLLGQSENPMGGDNSAPLPWSDEDI